MAKKCLKQYPSYRQTCKWTATSSLSVMFPLKQKIVPDPPVSGEKMICKS